MIEINIYYKDKDNSEIINQDFVQINPRFITAIESNDDFENMYVLIMTYGSGYLVDEETKNKLVNIIEESFRK